MTEHCLAQEAAKISTRTALFDEQVEGVDGNIAGRKVFCLGNSDVRAGQYKEA